MAFFRYNVRYTYQQYPFSKEATEYSKKIAYYKKLSVRIVIGFFLFCICVGVMIVLVGLLFPNMSEDMIFPFLVISMILGVILSIMVLRFNDQRLIKKRDAALKRDIAKLKDSQQNF